MTIGKRRAAIVRFDGNAIAIGFSLPFCDGTFHPAIIV
ncbi:hypothetical protein QO012_000509 [Methylobacterium aerolatum]|uniref:Uncharacterized protein n=1 Tax=Methylobacterium aerolatum TaxID=418708 RepID=A0ABU0HUM5_9HYPH|nr:hypothetical protein [Methylobacterium aerolatum]